MQRIRTPIKLALAAWGVASALGTGGVRAQAFDPIAFEREIGAIDDTLRLDALAGLRRSEQMRADRDAQLALGMLLVRRWELTGHDDELDRARRAFDRVRDIAPQDPWGHWGRGLTLARGPDVRSHGAALGVTGRSWAATFGLDARSNARSALAKALELDPRFDRAAAVLAEIALQERDTARMRRAYDALLGVLGRRNASDHSVMMLARLADLLGDRATAVEAGALIADRPDATGEQVHAYALALLRTPGRERDGAHAYFAAIDRASPALIDRLWAETSPIMRPSELVRWDSAGFIERKAILRNFWDVRAGMAALPVHERLAEHYRRLAIALERYGRSTDGPMLAEAINQQWPTPPVDERGVMYIRHGEPLEIIRTAPLLSPGSAMCPKLNGDRVVLGSPDGVRWRAPGPAMQGSVDNESWVYRGEDGRYRLMNFLRCRGFTDYAIPYDVPCGSAWMEERKAYDMDLRYCGWETRERVREYTREAFVTDTDAPDFEATIPFGYDLLAFRGFDGKTDLSAPVAVLADSLVPDTLRDGTLAISLALSMFLVDTVHATAVSADTTQHFRYERAPEPGSAVVAYVNLTVDPTADALQRIVVRDVVRPLRGRMHGQHILVPSFVGDSLMLSTIVLAVPGEGGNWRRGTTELTVMPVGEFAGGDFRAFYEIYNLVEDTPYETEISVERERDERGRLLEPAERVTPVIQLRFQDVADPDPNGIVQELRSVESDLPPGQYRIHIRVRNLDTRETAVSERFFTVTRG